MFGMELEGCQLAAELDEYLHTRFGIEFHVWKRT